MRLARAFVGQEKRGAFRLFRENCSTELGAHLVGFLRDRRSNRGNDPFGSGAELLHGLDRCLDDAGKRAPPARMRGADDPGLGVAEQDRARNPR